MTKIQDVSGIVPVARSSKLSDIVVETLSRQIVQGVIEPRSVIRIDDP